MQESELFKLYWQKAMAYGQKGESLRLLFASEGEAVVYRAALNKYRRKAIDELSELDSSFDDLSLKLRPQFEEDQKTPTGAYYLLADLPKTSFQDALATALGEELLEAEKSAVELLNPEDLQ